MLLHSPGCTADRTFDTLVVEDLGRGARRRSRAVCAAASTPPAPGAFGHSRGGAAAAVVMDLDAWVRAGADLDGALFGPVGERGLDRPFPLMDTAVHDDLNEDASWAALWENPRGRRRCLRLADAERLSFTDLVALAPQLREALPLPVGTVPADRAVAGVRATVRAFFDAHLRGRPDTSHVPTGASPRRPEIRYVAG